MDAFFASVEQRDDPRLRGLPVAVGGAGERGVVAAASYEARAAGVSSAMPMVHALRRCPDLMVVPARPARYRAVSRDVMDVLAGFTPIIEQLSLDEAFLDVSGVQRLFGDAVEIATQVRARIRDETGLSCSIGVAQTKSVAKILSSQAKPDGVLAWPAHEVVARLAALDVGVLWGVGPHTRTRLHAAGITTVGSLAATPESWLTRIVGDDAGRLRQLAIGVDPRPVSPQQPARSLSTESTFTSDVTDLDELSRLLRRMSSELARRLRMRNQHARTFTVKLRDAQFVTTTRSTTRRAPTSTTRDVVATTQMLLRREDCPEAVRLIGVGASNLDGQVTQLEFDDDDQGRWTRLDHVGDEIASRYGVQALRPAVLLARQQTQPPDITPSAGS